ncbi:MAG: HlyD family efflux transporter periplasmic adaptor subunit [Rhodanobacter sp.]|uniref:efflux RND transporter periplasmic adaptor subunit n=1 Tax=Rhodanobacter sp. OR444 TaxID=1076525 RepID=UPI000401C4FA|nr:MULTISPECIES: efflux RND transporter periplasmic adaptor subunit [Rhodanobacter]TAN14872.1 MAG: HlyD family efflux transporter periplasmic adaptor subunit [Rhodanobacter sp.]UJJ56329.1 efflux RND transporter periplasmic adaptor subunit [Rhodanobacter thiooxydans]
MKFMSLKSAPIKRIALVLLVLATVALGACGDRAAHEPAAGEHAAADAFERGPHNGRLLRDGSFALEVTVYEAGVPPEFRLYGYRDGKLLPPDALQPLIEIRRLDGETTRFTFRPEGDALVADGTVIEPHSFDVKVSAVHAGKTHAWNYASYEGRVTIPAAIAVASGVKTSVAGPATIRDVLPLMGRVAIDRSRQAMVRARFPGIVRSVPVNLGDRVRRGQTLATVEGNDSMRSYTVTAPLDGVVLARNTNVGDVAGEAPLFEIADLSSVWVELHAVGRDADRLRPGQAVRVRPASGGEALATRIDALVPVTHMGTSVVARARILNPDGAWRPGMAVVGDVTVAQREVPLAVKVSGLQRFRDFTVVFARVGDTYEVRMLELGARDAGAVEVLGGLKPGTAYVSEQSFLIRADIEKSGASHDH